MKKGILYAIIVIVLIIVIGVVGAFLFYRSALEPISSESNEVVVEIEKGSAPSTIANVLEEKELIKSALVFKIYTKLNNVSGMQAGTYKLNQNMSMEEIIDALQKGSDYFPDEISITFLEGKNMRWIAKTIAEKTNNTENDVFEKLEDKKYIQTLIEKYWFLTDEILDENIYYPLEGYLFPDTYSFVNKDVTVEQIFESMLNQMEEKLEDYKAEIDASNYSVHELITLASVVESEAAREEDRPGIASVFYNRIKKNMSLGSDVTTYYAIKVDMSERELYQSELNKYNPYNTRGPRMEGKLPVGPISTISIKSFESALKPDNTNYLYFVSDKNGKTYFAETQAEHDKNIQTIKSNNLWYNW